MKSLFASITLSLVLLTSISCHKGQIRVGAPNIQASQAETGLQVAADSILEAKKQLKSGALPKSAVGPLNALIESYNFSKAGLKTYTDVLALPGSNATPYLQTLNNDLLVLANRLVAFQQLMKGSK